MFRRSAYLLFVVSTVAFAQTPPTPRALFDEGTALYAKGDFAAAARKFEASFAARPVPVTKFNIARAWEQAGETLKAIDAWQAWLSMSPAAPERPAAEQSLASLGARLAKLGVQAVTFTSLPAGTRVAVDGVAVGVTPLTVELTPTRHLVRLAAAGRAPIEQVLVVSLDRPVVQNFELVGVDDTGPAPLQAAAPTPLYVPTVPRPTDAAFAASLGDDAVQVHIAGADKEVRLYRANGNPNGECRAPCDVPVSRASDHFFISGGGIVPSNAFVLLDHAHGGNVSLTVKSRGSAGWLVGGGTLFTTLAVAGFAIAFAFGIGSSSDKALPVGLGLLGGVAGTVGAVLCFTLNGTTISFAGE